MTTLPSIFFVLATTSNLLSHLKTKHSKEHTAANLKSMGFDETQKDSDSKESNIFSGKFDQKKLETAIVDLFVLQDLPFELIESDEFWMMLRLCNINVKKFGADKLRQLIKKDYESTRTDIKQIITENKSKFAFCHDAWTVENDVKQFLGITCHYIDDDYSLNNVLLDFAPLPASHTGAAICDVVEKVIFEDYEIPESKVTSFTLDNASSNNTFMEEIRKRRKCLECAHNRCYCHVQNLGVRALHEKTKSCSTALVNGIRYIRASPKHFERLTRLWLNKHKTMDGFVKPILFCPTRWDYLFEMLSTALKLGDPLKVIL